jgi:gamma-glutamyltranspeptidase / glutathione hydrolase
MTYEPPTRPTLLGNFGMVASTHWLASACGMSVLEAGGNAFDAAVAAGFVLQVVEPNLCGPAGEMPAVVWSERDRRVEVICGQGVAPQAATIDHFRELGLDVVPGTGPLAAVVPGAFGGWMLMLKRWGTWRVADVLAYAIGYARDGFPTAPLVAQTIDTVAEMFRADWPTSGAAWLAHGRVPRVGERLRREGLADTYERVVRESARADRDAEIDAAVDVWYRGFVAEEIVRFCAGEPWVDTSGERHRGLLGGDDLAAWSATVETPESYDFGNYSVFKTSAWGQGPVLLQQLALLDAADIWSVPYATADYLHLLIEAGKLAFADREAWYGDSGQVPDLVAQLLDPAYNFDRAALIDATASLELRPGSVDGRAPRIPSDSMDQNVAVSGVGYGEPTLGARGHVPGDTCHVDVVDQWGNLVSATPSGGWMQSSPEIPALGFSLGTRAQMFSLEQGHPNSLRPGARPRTTLTPSLAFRSGEPWMAFGTPGGDQQDQWSLAFFCSVVLGDLSLQQAIDAPAFTSDHVPGSFFPRRGRAGRVRMETRFGQPVIDALRTRGHDIVTVDPWSLGRLSAVSREADGFYRAAANPRGGLGYAVGR